MHLVDAVPESSSRKNSRLSVELSRGMSVRWPPLAGSVVGCGAGGVNLRIFGVECVLAFQGLDL
jgi:hypothetical protein